MQNSIQTFLVMIGSVAVASLLAMPTEAAAQGSWTNNSEASLTGVDYENHLIMALIKEPGRGPAARRLRKDRPATFQFNPDSAAGDETIVMIDGKRGELADIPENATVHIHWRPLDNNPSAYQMSTLKVVYFSEGKLAERRESAE